MLVVLVLAGLRVGVTPVGRPVTVRATGLLDALRPVTAIVLPMLLPVSRVSVLADAERLKTGCVMVRVILAVLLAVPEVPVTFTW